MKTARRVESFSSLLVYAHHLLVMGVGVFGMIEDPSPTIALVIGGRLAATIWSAMFAIFGFLAFGCRIANRNGWLDTTRSEALCIVFIGFGMAMFGTLIGFSTHYTHTPGSWQTALILLAGSVFLPGVAGLSLASTRRERLLRSVSSKQILDGVASELRK